MILTWSDSKMLIELKSHLGSIFAPPISIGIVDKRRQHWIRERIEWETNFSYPPYPDLIEVFEEHWLPLNLLQCNQILANHYPDLKMSMNPFKCGGTCLQSRQKDCPWPSSFQVVWSQQTMRNPSRLWLKVNKQLKGRIKFQTWDSFMNSWPFLRVAPISSAISQASKLEG